MSDILSDDYKTNKNNENVDYIKSDNKLLGENIQVHYEDFPKPDIGDFIDMFAPEQIYLRMNYPKISLNYKDKNNSIINYDDVDVNINLYKPYNQMIVFAIFPIGGLSLNDGLYDYVDMPLDELQKYPSLSITPTGNFISSGIIPDYIFKNNGLYNDYADEPLLSENKGIFFEYGDRKNTKTVYFNSGQDIREIVVYNWKIDKEQSSSNLTLTTNDFGKVSQSASGDFTYINGNAITSIKGITSLNKNLVTTSSSSTSSSSISNFKRTYILDDYNIIHPEIVTEDENATYEEDSDAGLSFFIAVDFLQDTKGFCEINFGDNIFKLPTDGSPEIKLADDNKSITCSLDKDINNLPLLPKFLNCDGFKRAKTAIFYPVWNGIAIQPGISVAKTVGLFREGEQAVYPVGTIAECQLNKNDSRSKYMSPSYTDWVLSGRDGTNPKSGHIKLIPNNARWADKLSITFNNTIGNFFYMPIFFVPHSKFRMFFSGMKVGEYLPVKDPDIDYSYIYKYSGTTDSLIKDKSFPEYSYPVETDDENEDISKGKLIYLHSYEGSVIYSYPEDNFHSNVAFISEKINATMIPPKIPEDMTEAEELQFWREYDKTTFFFDFEIKNPLFVEDGSIYSKGLPRKPVEIFGILLTHKREIKNSPIKNENGTFIVEPQEDIEDFKSNKLFDHELECDCPSNWIHYATNININHNQDGSEGNIILDKYALMGQDIFPKQSFGGIKLKLEGGNENFIYPSSSEYSTRKSNYIFSGIATETKHMDSFNSDTLDITLKGLQYKLDDIKLINAPFYDGDDLVTVMKWMSKYSGIEINMDFASSSVEGRTLPISSNFAKPALMLTMGTPVIEGIKQACEMCNHRFILQPNGVGYVYELDSAFSLPLVCKPGYSKATVLDEISTDSILSIDVQPIFSNLYNVVISAALLGKNNTTEASNPTGNVVEVKLNEKISHMITEPNLPWSRVIANSWKGYMSEDELSKRHAIDRAMSKRYWIDGSISIPGNANIWIYDQIKIFGQYFYITSVSHSIDFATKNFKTTVSISKYLEES